MTALFYPPKFNSELAGSKLTFTQTGTTTPQNTYQEEALSTPHANPVIADAAGVFAPIYLDPSLPSYRVRWTTAADVLIYQSDGVPSNQSTSTSSRIVSTTPQLLLYDTDGTSNQRKFAFRVIGSQLDIGAWNDAENSYTSFLRIEGGVSQRLVLDSGTKVDDGVTEYPIAYSVEGTFTGTLTGCTTSPTATLRYVKVGSLVTLFIPSAGDGLSGTSNSTAMTITGMPSGILPSRTQTLAFPSVGDNSALIGDGEAVHAQISASGVITFLINGSATGFTGSGTKGTSFGATVNYLIT
jgi:hypothetical protein